MQVLRNIKAYEEFQSTPSARRATKEIMLTGDTTDISIHALREEGDVVLHANTGRKIQFQSTPSARRATVLVLDHQLVRVISIHALREEGDRLLVISRFGT